MSSRKRGGKPRREAPKGELKQPRPVWFVTLMAFVLPGSGQMLNGAPARGVIMQFGMVFGGYVSYQLTTPEISPIGRLAGGLLVWVFSIVDANGIANRRVRAWARIKAAQQNEPARTGGGRTAVESDRSRAAGKNPRRGSGKGRVHVAARDRGQTADAEAEPASESPARSKGSPAAVVSSTLVQN